jgi:hypothetical protein
MMARWWPSSVTLSTAADIRIAVVGGAERLLTASFILDFINGLTWTTDDREIIFGGTHLRRVSASGSEPTIANISYVPGPAAFPVLRDHMLKCRRQWMRICGNWHCAMRPILQESRPN